MKNPKMLQESSASTASVPSGSVAETATDASPRERRCPERRGRLSNSAPLLRFTPYAWAKLLFFRDAGDTEIGGFGITRLTGDDLLLVEDFVTVKEAVTSVSVAFDDSAVADFFERQVDLGRRPEQFSRIWVHTHPGSSPTPSGTDEETFARAFGVSDWAVMHILAKGGQTYTRLRFNVGPGGEQLLKTEVSFDESFGGSDTNAWMEEYLDNVVVVAPPATVLGQARNRQRESREEDLQEALLEEYAAFWGEERRIFE